MQLQLVVSSGHVSTSACAWCLLGTVCVCLCVHADPGLCDFHAWAPTGDQIVFLSRWVCLGLPRGTERSECRLSRLHQAGKELRKRCWQPLLFFGVCVLP